MKLDSGRGGSRETLLQRHEPIDTFGQGGEKGRRCKEKVTTN